MDPVDDKRTASEAELETNSPAKKAMTRVGGSAFVKFNKGPSSTSPTAVNSTLFPDAPRSVRVGAQLVTVHPLVPSKQAPQQKVAIHQIMSENSPATTTQSSTPSSAKKRKQDDDDSEDDGGKDKSRLLPKKAQERLHIWFNEHLSNPYPTKDDMMQLVGETSLTETQVANWFANTRRRNKQIINHPDETIKKLQGWFMAHLSHPYPRDEDLETLEKEITDTNNTMTKVAIQNWMQQARNLNRMLIKAAMDTNQPWDSQSNTPVATVPHSVASMLRSDVRSPSAASKSQAIAGTLQVRPVSPQASLSSPAAVVPATPKLIAATQEIPSKDSESPQMQPAAPAPPPPMLQIATAPTPPKKTSSSSFSISALLGL